MAKMKHVKELKIVEHNDQKGHTYECGPLMYIETKPGVIRADHTHPYAETFWMLDGKFQLQIGDEVIEMDAPCKIEIPAGVYHKLIAITQTNFIEKRHVTSS